MSGADNLERSGYRDVMGAAIVEGDRVEVVGPLRDDPSDAWGSMVGETGTVALVTVTSALVDFGRAALALPHRRLRRLS